MENKLQLIKKEDGLYICINKTLNKGEVIQETKRLGIIIPDHTMESIISSQIGHVIKLSENDSDNSNQDEVSTNFKLSVTDNKMQAFLVINRDAGHTPDKIALVEHLVAQGLITECIDVHGIEAAIDSPGTIYQVASGKNAIEGDDALIEYYFQEPDNKPVLLENGNVDYYNLGKISPVAAGDIIAKRQPPSAGKPGTNIYGETIPAVPGKNVDLKTGKGIIISNDQAIAEYDGAISWTNGKVQVEKLFTVKGNVDFSTGNINFSGKVLVTGNVEDGFCIEADDDVEVRGGVGNARLTSGKGSIFVQNGIIGRGQAILSAHKNIEAKFIQEATIEAGESIIVNEYIIRCYIKAGDSVLIQGRKGRIMGKNEIMARTKIKASKIQNANELDLHVEGIERKQYYHRVKELNNLIKDLEETIRQYTQNIRKIRNNTKQDNISIHSLQHLLPDYLRLTTELEELTHQRQTLIRILKSTRGDGMIEIGGGVEEGLNLSIKNDAVKLPNNKCSSLNMYYDSDEKRIIIY